MYLLALLCFPILTFSRNPKSEIIKSKANTILKNDIRRSVPINGKVIDQTSGQALAGVSVQVKGSKVGESTDATGSFRINVEPGTVLIFSIVGYENQEVKTDSRLEYTISMVPKTGRLDAVVVSALGIKRTEKSLSYASRQIGGEQVSNVKADPATAKLHVEKALADPGGLLSISSDLAQIFGIYLRCYQ